MQVTKRLYREIHKEKDNEYLLTFQFSAYRFTFQSWEGTILRGWKLALDAFYDVAHATDNEVPLPKAFYDVEIGYFDTEEENHTFIKEITDRTKVTHFRINFDAFREKVTDRQIRDIYFKTEDVQVLGAFLSVLDQIYAIGREDRSNYLTYSKMY